jgi:hypothetical protein
MKGGISMYQDISLYGGAGPILWCAVKCGAACAGTCVLDGPGPLDVVGAAYGFVDWGGK